ncbi:MAG: low molecular weight phosphotyrosine protein phosphatase [Phycisphaerales bacterium]|nr:low molecular weight phosphotyrosine protein phosphatase [Phycisphaerales bacterium]
MTRPDPASRHASQPLIPLRRPDADRFGVLFVCLGNICRSPMAEAIFIHHATARGLAPRLDIDSCGLGEWHVGGPADPRTVAACRARGVGVPSIARLWNPRRDPARFDLILPMDRQNHRTLLNRDAPRDRVRMMRQFEPADAASRDHASRAAPAPLLFPDAGAIPDVPDPYTGPDSGFDDLYDMLERSCLNLLDHIERSL